MSKDSRLYLAAFCQTAKKYAALVKQFGGVEQAIQYLQINKDIVNIDLPVDVQIVFKGEAHYPEKLKNMCGAPEFICYSGNLNLINSSLICLTGTRYADDYGLAVAKMYAMHLARCDKTIITGISLGSETAILNTLLKENGAPVCVLPCGHSRITPVSNYDILRRTAQQGGLVLSSCWPTCSVLPGAYFDRNRLMAFLCDELVVTQCKTTGGVHITVRECQKLQKKIWAVPARIGGELSGTNHLIAEGATISCAPEDIALKQENSQPVVSDSQLNDTQLQVYRCVQQGVGDINLLVDSLPFDVQSILQAVSELESAGYIIYGANGTYMTNI